MTTIKIKVSEFYDNAKYYSVMQEEIFDELERANQEGKEYAEVDRELFNEMIEKFKYKLKD